jgi:RNA-binding protein
MNSQQRQYLKGLAHPLKPVVFVGKAGLSTELAEAANLALEDHELIKLKFNDHKDRKNVLADAICRQTASQLVGLIGHVAILYRPARNPDKRKIQLP